jgi:hypothetical protein
LTSLLGELLGDIEDAARLAVGLQRQIRRRGAGRLQLRLGYGTAYQPYGEEEEAAAMEEEEEAPAESRLEGGE